MARLTRDWLIDTHGSRDLLGTWVEQANYPNLSSQYGYASSVIVLPLGASLLFNAALDGTGWTWTGGGSAPGDLTVTTGGTIGSEVSQKVLTAVSVWLYVIGSEFGADQDMHWYLDADPTPADYSVASYPGQRSEVELALLPFDALVDGWVEFVMPSSAVASIRDQVTNQPTWDGRVSLVAHRDGAPSSGFLLWGTYSPFMRVTYEVAESAVAERPYSWDFPKAADDGIEGAKQKARVRRILENL